jgi:hypothetical protein
MPEQAVSRPSVVARTVADPASAKAHFVERLSVETDADDVASALAALGRSVKEMLGGFEYWVREGRPVEGDDAGSGRYAPDLSGLITLPGEGACWCAAPAMHEPPHAE